MTYRSTPSFAIGGMSPKFVCAICGAHVPTCPVDGVRGICEEHCSDHDFEYDGFAGDRFCIHCGKAQEYEPCDDDVGIGGGYAHVGPIGILASSMDGNAANRNDNPAAWANWLAFCNANGHP